MTARMSRLLFALAACALSIACSPPHSDLPPDQIEKLDSLSKVMDVNATIADPQFGKSGQASYTDQDWAAFTDMATRLQVTAKKAHQFSMGKDFDTFADALGHKAQTLGDAATAKDAKAASDALVAIKATCKACHSKFK